MILNLNLALFNNNIESTCNVLAEEIEFSCSCKKNKTAGKSKFIRICRIMIERVDIKKYEQWGYRFNFINNLCCVKCNFKIEYDSDDIRYIKSGYDKYVFQNHGQNWKLISRDIRL